MRASVIIPCRDAERTVADAVASALAQSEPPLEVLVVDDASSDASADVARKAGARVLVNAVAAQRGRRPQRRHRGDLGRAARLPRRRRRRGSGLARARPRSSSRRIPSIAGVGGRIVNGRPGRFGELDYFLNHSEWIGRRERPAREAAASRRWRSCTGATPSAPARFPESNSGEDTAFALAVAARGGRLWYDPAIRVTHRHERLDFRAFWEKQLACGRTIFQTRSTPRPARPDPRARPDPALSLSPPLDHARADGPRGPRRQGRDALPVAPRRRDRADPGLLRGARQRAPRGAGRAGRGRRRGPGMSGARRLRQGLALARDWIAPGEAIAQWTHFVTSVCNARCAHCFYPINAGKNELTLEEIDRFARDAAADPPAPHLGRRALPPPGPARAHPGLLRALRLLQRLDPDQRLLARRRSRAPPSGSAASRRSSRSASRSRSTASASSTTACAPCPASTTARSRRSRRSWTLSRSTPEPDGRRDDRLHARQPERSSRSSASSSTTRYRPESPRARVRPRRPVRPARQGGPRRRPLRAALPEDRLALSSGRGPDGLEGRAHAGPPRGQPPPLRVHRPAGARAAGSRASAWRASGSTC